MMYTRRAPPRTPGSAGAGDGSGPEGAVGKNGPWASALVNAAEVAGGENSSRPPATALGISAADSPDVAGPMMIEAPPATSLSRARLALAGSVPSSASSDVTGWPSTPPSSLSSLIARWAPAKMGGQNEARSPVFDSRMPSLSASWDLAPAGAGGGGAVLAELLSPAETDSVFPSSTLSLDPKGSVPYEVVDGPPAPVNPDRTVTPRYATGLPAAIASKQALVVAHSTPPGTSSVTPLMYRATVGGSTEWAAVTASAGVITASYAPPLDPQKVRPGAEAVSRCLKSSESGVS